MAERRGAPRARRGETFIEVLVALLIVALSTLLLTAMVGAAGSIDLTARQKDEKFYEALSKVETMQGPEAIGDYTVTITDRTGAGTAVGVEIYTSDNFTAYRAK